MKLYKKYISFNSTQMLKTMLKVLIQILKKYQFYKKFTEELKRLKISHFSTLKNYVENYKKYNNKLYKIVVNAKTLVLEK